MEDGIEFMHMVLQKPAAKWGTPWFFVFICKGTLRQGTKQLQFNYLPLEKIPIPIFENVNTNSHANVKEVQKVCFDGGKKEREIVIDNKRKKKFEVYIIVIW